MPIETVQVTTDETASGYMIINREDFDPAVHTLFGQSEASAPAPKKTSSKKSTE